MASFRDGRPEFDSHIKTLWLRSSYMNGRINMVIMLIVSQVGKCLNIYEFFFLLFFCDLGS